MTMRMSYFRKMEKDGILAQRSSIMRTCALYGDYVLVIEKEEWYSDSYPVPNVFYVIGIEGNGGFDYTELGIHRTLSAAWADWNATVGDGLICSLQPSTRHTVINYITGEIIQYPVLFGENALTMLEERIYEFWGYLPASHKWRATLEQYGVTDLKEENGKGCAQIFWNEDNEFFIRECKF